MMMRSPALTESVWEKKGARKKARALICCQSVPPFHSSLFTLPAFFCPTGGKSSEAFVSRELVAVCEIAIAM